MTLIVLGNNLNVGAESEGQDGEENADDDVVVEFVESVE